MYLERLVARLVEYGLKTETTEIHMVGLRKAAKYLVTTHLELRKTVRSSIMIALASLSAQYRFETSLFLKSLHHTRKESSTRITDSVGLRGKTISITPEHDRLYTVFVQEVIGGPGEGRFQYMSGRYYMQ